MTKADVSAVLGKAEQANPHLIQDRERVKAKARDRKFGSEIIAEEEQWIQLADRTEYILAIYRRDKEIVADVLRVNEAWINERGKLMLSVEAPKLVKDRHIGEHLDWDRHFELSREKLLYFEPLHRDFHEDGKDAYRQIVKRGLKLARKLSRSPA